MKTILVVDDDSRVRNIIRLIFEPLNYRVVDTQNGKDAALKAREIKPDIVLADVSLPDKDGYEILKEIKNNLILKKTPVILLADSDEELDKVRVKAAEAGADDLATKLVETEFHINLTGEWKLIHKVERTLYNPYKGMTLGYRATLKQNGKNIVGKAEKWWEDGEKIPPTARSRILIVGTLDGRILTATFVEEGTLRTTSGSFVWTVSPDGKELQGSFTSNAAGSSGISVGNKIL